METSGVLTRLNTGYDEELLKSLLTPCGSTNLGLFCYTSLHEPSASVALTQKTIQAVFDIC